MAGHEPPPLKSLQYFMTLVSKQYNITWTCLDSLGISDLNESFALTIRRESDTLPAREPELLCWDLTLHVSRDQFQSCVSIQHSLIGDDVLVNSCEYTCISVQSSSLE